MSPDDPSSDQDREQDRERERDRDRDRERERERDRRASETRPARAPRSRVSIGRDRLSQALRTPPVRGRRVRRTLRQVDPWSVLKLSLLFYAAVFLIVCVASAFLWTGARASGSLDNLESFITSVGGFGTCEPIPGSTATTPTTTATTLADGDNGADQLDPSRVTTTEPDATPDTRDEQVSDDGTDCPTGERLVGAFHFEDSRIFEAFAFGGVVLVLAGTGFAVVMVLLFNLMSDLTGGVQVWVVEEETRPRRGSDAGSPPPKARG